MANAVVVSTASVNGTGGSAFSMFDPTHAGYANYGEEEELRRYNEMSDADELLRQYKEISKRLDEMHRRTGGYINGDPCQESEY